MKNPTKVKQGENNRRSGAAFEKRVRKNLEEKGWIVDKWTNNVQLPLNPPRPGTLMDIVPRIDLKTGKTICPDFGKLVPAKPKYNPFTHRIMMNSAGFPDFIIFSRIDTSKADMKDLILRGDDSGKKYPIIVYDVIGIESKSNGQLKKIEKEKCRWLLDNKIFSKILIAKKVMNGRKINVEYTEFE